MDFLYPNLVPSSWMGEAISTDNEGSARPLLIRANGGVIANEDSETLHVTCPKNAFGGVACLASLSAMGLSSGDVVRASVDLMGADPNPAFGLRLTQYSGGGTRWGWYVDAMYADAAIGGVSQAEWSTKEFKPLALGDVSARPWLCIAVIGGTGFDVRLRHLMVQKSEPRAWAPASGEVWP